MAKDAVTIWWRCEYCGRLFTSPVYEPCCPPCCNYQGTHNQRWTLFEELFAGAIIVILLALTVLLRWP